MSAEANRTSIEDIYPPFALATSKAKELKQMSYNESPKQALEQAMDMVYLLGELCENRNQLLLLQKELPEERLLGQEATTSVQKRIITLFTVASQAFSTDKRSDCYWPVTWEEREEETRNIAEILDFWIKNERQVTATKARDDLCNMIEAWCEADLQYLAWKASRKLYKPKPPTPELVLAESYRERFGPNWGKKARGRMR